MNIYTPKLYAKKIPEVNIDSAVGQRLLNSEGTKLMAVPGMNTAESKNLRSISLKNIIKYIAKETSDEYECIYGTNTGSKSGTTITLSKNINTYKSILFIYGLNSSRSFGSVSKTTIELNELKKLTPSEIRLVELSSGAITISNLTNTSFNAGVWINTIISIYGIGITGN